MRRDSCPSTTFPRRTSAGTCSRRATTRRTVPFKGDASYWSVRVGDRVAENAMWGYPEPIEGAPQIAGYLAFYWNTMEIYQPVYEDEGYLHSTGITECASCRHRPRIHPGFIASWSNQEHVTIDDATKGL